MKLFGKKQPKSFLGIDIGSSGMKLVELANEHGRARLLTYGFTDNIPDINGKVLFQDTAKATKVLKELLKTTGAKSRRAIVSLPVSSVYTSVIAIPEPKNQEEAGPLIESQASKLVPLPIEDMVLSPTFIDSVKKESVLKKEVGKKKGEEEEKKTSDLDVVLAEKAKKKTRNVRVLISAAPRSLVQSYVDIFKGAGVELDALDIESFGLIRALIGKDRSTVLLVDIGAMRTNLTVVEKGIPFLTRSVQVGGVNFTKALSDSLGVSMEEAEQMKFDLAMSNMSGIATQMVDKVFGQLINEIRYVFEQYRRQEFSDNKKVEKVIVTGGSAHLPGMTDFFVRSLNLNTYVGDPWARVVVPEDLRLLLDTIGPGMAISVGLAMRDLE